MATIVRSPSKAWKAVIRRKGWPTLSKSFRTKRDAEDWARRTEDEMVRGVHIQRSPSESMTISSALDRYLQDISPTKRPSAQQSEKMRAKVLKEHLGRYSMAALSPDIVADYRDSRLADHCTTYFSYYFGSPLELERDASISFGGICCWIEPIDYKPIGLLGKDLTGGDW